MSIEALTAILEAPPSPAEVPNPDDWPAIEKRLGTPLPEDYKAFIGHYGTGSIADFAWIFNPVSEYQYLNLFNAVKSRLDALRKLRNSGEQPSYNLFPEIGGLVPFGATDNGDTMFWRTREHRNTGP